MFDKLSDNLNSLMTLSRMSADELARQTGIPASTIKKIRNHLNPNPTLATLLPIAKYFSITLGQLVGEENCQSNSSIPEQISGATINNIPLISWEAAISWPQAIGYSYQRVFTELLCSHDTFGLIVPQDSLSGFEKNSMLIIDPSLMPENSDFVLVYKAGQRLPSIKQILLDEDDVYFKPPITGLRILPLTNEHRILGVVVEYRKYLKLGSHSTQI